MINVLKIKCGLIPVGIAVVPGAAGGHILGGLLVRFLKLKVRGILRMCAGFTLIASISGFVYLANCSIPNMAGVNVNYTNR